MTFFDFDLADLDADGDLDVAGVGCIDSKDGENAGAGCVDMAFVVRNIGNGAFGGVESYPGVDRSYSMAIGDLDGDGILDLLAGDREGGPIVLLADGDGGFIALTPSPSGRGVADVIAVDLDGDRAVDLVAANDGSDDLSILVNTCPPPPCPADIARAGGAGADGTVERPRRHPAVPAMGHARELSGAAVHLPTSPGPAACATGTWTRSTTSRCSPSGGAGTARRSRSPGRQMSSSCGFTTLS